MPQTDDKDIWSAYAKGVKRLAGKKNKPALLPKTHKKQAASSGKALVLSPSAPAKKHTRTETGFSHMSLDRNLERRLRQGDIAIDARLDLHGMRQEEAHAALNAFIAGSVSANDRCLLIITGKGRGGEGVLRASLAAWLAGSLHAAKILALRPAAIRHGGSGAFYVMLKRGKNR